MKKIFKKYYGIILSILVFLFFLIFVFFDSQELRIYSKTITFSDSYINMKIYAKNPVKVKNTFKKIEKIYKKYEQISDMKEYEDLSNVYYIKENKKKTETITIDNTLYKMLHYAKDFAKKNALYTVADGQLHQLWLSSHIPLNTSYENLEKYTQNMEDIVLLGNSKIKNTHVYLNIHRLALSFASKEVENLLKREGLSSYLINASGIILVGNSYQNQKYKIALEDSSKFYYKTIELENKVLSTTGESGGTFIYNEKKYAKKIHPSTKYPADIFKNVTVIGSDCLLVTSLSETLYLLSIEQGKEFMKQFPSMEVIWQTNENEVISFIS